MQYVKFIKALPGILEGSVRQVDENSAKALIDRGDAEKYDPSKAKPSESVPIQRHTRGNLAVTQVAAADLPVVKAGGDATAAEERVQTGTGAGEPAKVPDESATKAELVTYARGKVTHEDGTPLSDAELEALTKPELRSRLGL